MFYEVRCLLRDVYGEFTHVVWDETKSLEFAENSAAWLKEGENASSIYIQCALFPQF